jgi:hypothetical protein
MLSEVFFNGFYNYYVVRKTGGSFGKILDNVKVHLGIANNTYYLISLLNQP